jgi:PAS domain S-box-containing protein
VVATRQELLAVNLLRRAYRDFLDSLPHSAWIVSGSDTRTFQNLAARRYFGALDSSDVPGAWQPDLHEGDRQKMLTAIRSVREGDAEHSICVRFPSPDGYRWMRATVSRVPEGAGGGNAVLVTFNDIHYVSEWEGALNEAPSLYQKIVDIAGVGIWILDEHDRTIFVNGAVAEMLGYTRDEFMGKRPHDFMDEPDREGVNVRLKRRRQGMSEKIEVKYRRKDSSEVWTELAAIPITDTEGHYAGTAAMVVDITERKRAESLARGQTAALNRTLSLVATEPSLDTVLGHVLKAITEQLNVTSSALYLIDSESGMAALHMTYDHGQVTRGDESGQPMHLGARHVQLYSERWEGAGGNVPPAVLDVETSRALDGSMREWLQEQRIRTLVLVPLVVKDRLAGAFSVRMRERRAPGAGELDLAQSLAHQASLAVQLTLLAERARRVAVLEERNRAAVDRAAELSQANKALKHTLDVLATNPEMDDVMGHVLTVMTQILEGTTSTLWLKNDNEESATLHLVYQDGQLVSGAESGHRLAGQRLALSRTDLFAMAVFRLQRAVWHEVQRSAALDETAKIYLSSRGCRALLGIPMILGDKTIGSIVVRFSQLRQFGSVELELAQGLAQQATLALQMTRLAQQARTAAVTEERNRMAREIHDTLAQGFTGILIQLQAAAQVLNGAKPDVYAHIESARALARSGLSEARRSVRGLRPDLLIGADIASGLERLVGQLSTESHLKIRLEVTGERPRLSSEVESNVLRIAQEAITNAIKHSGGDQIFVKLNFDPEVLKLLVEDNGDGFDPHVSTLSRGFGLISLQERAERVGGVLTILTKPGAGTKVHLLVPLSNSTRTGVSHS